VIDRDFPLSKTAAARAYIEGREAFGRVVLKPLSREAAQYERLQRTSAHTGFCSDNLGRTT
jgi:hypothetical protein